MVYYVGTFNATEKLQSQTINATFKMAAYLIGRSGNSAAAWARAKDLGIDLPEEVTMTLLSNGQPLEIPDGTVSFQPGSDGVWPTMNKSWILPKVDANGNSIDYGELSVAYTPDLEKDELDKRFVQQSSVSSSSYNNTTNVTIQTQIPGIVDITMPTTWLDGNNEADARPQTISATLMADGVALGEAQTLNIEADGTIKAYPDAWKRLPQRNAEGEYMK